MKQLFAQLGFGLALLACIGPVQALGRLAQVQVIDRSTGERLPVHWHRGEYWVAGQPGNKYAIQIHNRQNTRLLAVSSVDGLNVLTGESADYGQIGYVLQLDQTYRIEGWRKSDREVAAFVFTASGDSYAERVGKPRDLGVVGVALFREKAPVPPPPAPAISDRMERRSASSSASGELRSAESETASSPNMDSRSAPAASATPSPKLGTAHGEREVSVVSRTQFERRSAQPDEVIRIRYDSHANLVAMGVIPSPRLQPAPNPFPAAAAGYVPDPPAWR
jgi:hypothetical protein